MQDERYVLAGPRPTICLIMDVANIPEDSIMPLVQELRRRGEVAAMFAFGDWHRRDMHLRHRLLDALGFLCIHGGSWENGSGGLKSMVDSIMKRTIKWVPQWFPHCNTYVLATGDRDFSHDASDLRWRGFRVWIAAGEASINNELRLGADEFISLDRLPNRMPPSAVLGVPSNYYETTYGNRGRFARPAPLPATDSSAPAPAPISRGSSFEGRPPAAPGPAARPLPPIAAAAPTPAPAVAMTPPPPVVASGEDEALLAQLRQLSGGSGYVALREALRNLTPADDAGGRARSRLSNQIRDLVERGLLVRTHATIGGNVTQVLALPGATIEPAPAPAVEADEAAPLAERRRPLSRGRLRSRPRSESEPSIEAEAVPEAVREIGAVVAPAEDEADLAAPEPRPEPERPPVAAAEVLPEPTVAAPPRPAPAETPSTPLRRFERPAPRTPEPAPAAAPSRPSWRDAVAAALAQARGEAGLAPAPSVPVAPPTVAPATVPTASEAAETAVAPLAEAASPRPDAPSLSAPAAEPVEATPTIGDLPPAEGGATEAAPAARRRRRRPAGATSAATAATPAGSSTSATATAEPAAAALPAGEPGAETPPAEEPARPRATRRGRRRPAAGGEAATATAGALPTP